MSNSGKNNLAELENSFSVLLPWWSNYKEDYSISSKTEDSAQNYLNRFFLFPINEITVGNSIENIQEFINSRYHSILAAAYSAGITVSTVIKGDKGKIQVFLGFQEEDGTKQNPEYYQALLNGMLPGEKIEIEKTNEFSSLIKDLPEGGIITGIPSLQNRDKDQFFNLSSVVRSMYSRKYILAIVSKPVSHSIMQERLISLMDLRDKCHEFAKITIGEESGSSSSNTEMNQTTKGKSETKTNNYGLSVIILNYSRNKSKATTENTASGASNTNAQNNSKSTSKEIQNGLFAELEKISDHFIERMIQGFNTGFWETSVTFAAQDKVSCDILGGSFIGELSKPSEKLFPPRLYIDNIDSKKIIFLPKDDSENPIFPKSLCSYITSEELSQISAPPSESLPGYEIKKMPDLALTDSIDGEYELGNIADHGNSIENSMISLSKLDLNKHLFVCGITGSGKTTTIKHILKNINHNDSIPFLVLESAKRDYRQLWADETFKNNLNIFTIGDATVSPIRFNPFYIQPGVHPLVHIDHLKAIFNASFSLYGPMPHILEKCLHNVFIKQGWNLTTGLHSNFIDNKGNYDEKIYNHPEHFYCFPTLSDLKNEVDYYVKKELGYKGELQDNIRTAIITRIESLSVGAKGLMFNTHDFYPLNELLNKNTIFEMENLADDDDKAFFVGLILVLISEFRQRDNPAINPGTINKGLRHLLVIEEAHRLLRNVNTERTSEMMGNPKGKAVEVFCNVISEMRSLGQGVAVVEQIPSKISPDVIKNSNTKIVHRIVSKDDQSLLAGSLSISDEDALYLNRLKTGHALCHKEGMERPVEFKVNNDVKSIAISDENVYKKMKNIGFNALHTFETYELNDLLEDKGKEIVIQFLNSICTVGFENFEKLWSILLKKLKNSSLEKSGQNFDEKVYEDYIVKCIMGILSKGLYYRRSNFPENLKFNLTNLFGNKERSFFDKVLKNLKEYWKEDPASFINKIVLNLTIKYIGLNPQKITQDHLLKTVEGFFLLPEYLFSRKICKEVNNFFGDQNG